MILLTHPTGNTFSRALAGALQHEGQLGAFATSVAVGGSEAWLSLLPKRMRSEMLRRRYDIPPEKLLTHPGREYVRLAATRLGLGGLTRHEMGWASFDAVYRDLDRWVARRLPSLVAERGIRGVYAYEDGAVDQFEAARSLGVKRFYELPIAYWETSRRLLAEEAERWPHWRQTLLAVDDSAEKCARKQRELELADAVICPSEFVRRSIPDRLREGRDCLVAEFGSPVQPEPSSKTRREKLRVLFAGSMTQRKGLADVFAAMKLLKRADVELVVAGSLMAPLEFYRGELSDFVYEPPRPHPEMLALMQQCDVLVLPSIVEGRALVQQEAMAQGLPIIVTANAGGEDLVDEGVTGFLVPIRSPAAIADRIAWFAEHRDQLSAMAHAAWRKASTLTWGRYTDRILQAICRRVDRSTAQIPAIADPIER